MAALRFLFALGPLVGPIIFGIPLAYWLAVHRGLQARGAFLAIPIAEGTLAIVSMILFRRGRWKTQKI